MTERVFTPAERRRGLAAIILGVFVVGVFWGLFTPGIALALERRGFEPWVIGLNSAMQPLAMLLFGAFVSRVAGRLGTLRAYLGGIGLAVASVAVMALTDDILVWFALRFLIGVGFALPWLVAETWINMVAVEGARGRVVAAYSSAFYGGLACGPLLVEVAGTNEPLIFALAAGLLVLAGLPVVVNHKLAPKLPARPELRLLEAARQVPIITGAALMAGLTEAAAFALLPIYGVSAGLDAGMAVLMLTAFTAGAITLQVPLGYLSDRVDRRRLLLCCVALNLVCIGLLPLVLGSGIWLWLLLSLWGGFVLGYYTIGLALLGERFSAAHLSVANALFIICYESGGVSGPILVGVAMNIWNPNGFLLALGLFGAGFLALAGFSGRSKRALP